MSEAAPLDELELRLQEAFAASDPLAALRAEASAALAAGLERSELEQRLEALRFYLQAQEREDEEDLVLELLDFVVGWCPPGEEA